MNSRKTRHNKRPRRRSSVAQLRYTYRSLDSYTRGVAAEVAACFKKLLRDQRSFSQHADNRLSLAMEPLEDRVLLSATVSIGDAQVSEGGDLQFAVTLSEAVAADTLITYSTADGSAKIVDDDYTGQTAQTITIPGGQTAGIISIATTADSTVEPDETLNVNLIAASSAANLPFTQLAQDIDGEAVGDESGHSVAVSADGNTLVVGARFNDGSGSDAGQARVYDWNGVTSLWQQRGLDIDGEAASDLSGTSVAVSADGQTLVVGARFNDGSGGFNAGQARVYDWNGVTSLWQQRGLDIDGEAASDRSGTSVAVSADGQTLVVGAPFNDGNGFDAGQARVYDWNGVTSLWQQRGLDIDGEAAFDRSGTSVAVSADGQTLVVGAPFNDGNGFNAGQARVYDWNGVTSLWQQRGLDIDGEAVGDQSGHSVALSGDGNTLVVGAPRNDGGGFGSTVGQARVYDWNGVTSLWQQRGLDIDGEAADDGSGYSVALSSDGNTLVVGAPFNDDGGSDAGQARVYDLGAGTVQISDAQGVGTILNDDLATISISDLSKAEGDSGTTAFQFTVDLDNAASKNVTVEVALGALGDTAVAGTDYIDFGTQTVTFLPGQTAKTVTVNVFGDEIVEADETFTVSLVAGSAQFFGDTDATRAVIGSGDLNDNNSEDDSIATGTITNIDSAAFTVDSVSGAEAGGALTFTVTLSNAVDVATSVDVGVTLNIPTTAADFPGPLLPANLFFAPGETSQTYTVTPFDDNIEETDETFNITLAIEDDGGRDVTASAVAGVGTILNDDATLSIAGDTAPAGNLEGTAAAATAYTFTATRSGDTSGSTNVDWAVGSANMNAADFAGGALPGGTLNFVAGEISKTITINVNADSLVEADESFSVTLSNASPVANTSIGTATAGGTVNNDDKALVSIDDVTELENGTFEFTVSLSHAASEEITLTLDTADGTTDPATAGDDYTEIAGQTVTFATGETSQEVTVTVSDDNVAEDDETFKVNLSGVEFDGDEDLTRADFAVGGDQGIGTIVNDDATLSIAADGLNPIKEGTSSAATAYTFTVTRSGDTSGVTTVDWEVFSATMNAADFPGGVIPSGSLTFASGVTSKTIKVHVVADSIVEADESFTVTLSSEAPSANTSLATPAASGFIINDDYLALSTFTVTTSGDSGMGTLRQAITNSNTTPGPDIIKFNIAGGGTHTIQPLSALPTITEQVVIDGSSQPGFAGAPLIEIDGSLAVGASVNGLTISGGDSIVRALTINRFSANGIWLTGSGNNSILGNYIGTDITGELDQGNGHSGVFISSSASNSIGGASAFAQNLISGNDQHGVSITAGSSGNVLLGNLIGTDIGGSDDLGNSLSGVFISNSANNLIGRKVVGAENVISGNDQDGVTISGAASTFNRVRGNLIGTDVTGLNDVGNERNGVFIHGAASNRVGGLAAGSGNLISGNQKHGVSIVAGSTGNVVQHNKIGTDINGTGDLGNTLHGVKIVNGSSNLIGTDGRANSIAFNQANGVMIKGMSVDNSVRFNSIFSNVGLGIDLNNDGVTPNDAGDADTGPNNLQNSPDSLSANLLIGGDLQITYTVDSAPANSTYPLLIQFFLADGDGEEGQTLIGSDTYTAADQTAGAKTITFTPSAFVNPDDIVLATATDDNGAKNTSEFSQAVVVNAAPTATNLTQTKTYTEGDASVALDDIVVSDLNTSPAQTITATLTLADPARGVLTAGSGNGETYTAGTGIWTVTGNLAQVNAALAAVAFTPVTNNDVDTTITTHVEDQGGGGPVDGTITLDVSPAIE